MAEPKGEAFRVIHETKPKHTYRGAVVGCGRMGSTIDDEHIGNATLPWPWAHAPAMIEARGVDLVAGADVDQAKLDDFKRRWGTEALYTDYREMVEKEQPDIVCLTTRPNPCRGHYRLGGGRCQGDLCHETDVPHPCRSGRDDRRLPQARDYPRYCVPPQLV